MSSAELSTKEGEKGYGGTVCTSTTAQSPALLKRAWEEATPFGSSPSSSAEIAGGGLSF